MRFNISSLTLLALASYFSTSFALPLSTSEKLQPKALLPRASYSVVPVDGGASPTGGSGGSGQPEATVTIIETTTQTAPAPPPTTVTFVQDHTVSAATVTVTSISSISAQKDFQTILVTVTHTSAVTPAVSSAHLSSFSTATISGSSSITSSTSSSIITPAAVVTKTYDNGLWHTTYPAWSNSTTKVLGSSYTTILP